MSWNPIVIGNAPNDGTGTNWRECWNRVNNYNAEQEALRSRIISAADDRFKNETTTEAKIVAAIAQAILELAQLVFIPAFMLPFDITLITNLAAFNATSGRLVREGGDFSVYDVLAYGAKDNGTGNDSIAIQAAHDAMPATGHTLVLGSSHRIATTVTFSKAINATGKGRRVLPGGGSTRLIKASTLNGPGILMTGGNNANGSIIQSFQLDGEVGNLGDGIVLGTNYCGIRDVTVTGMGQDGFRVGRDTATNVNLWYLENCFALSNGRHGFNIDDPAGVPDANAGTLIQCDASTNGGDGLRVGKARFCSFYNFTTQANTGAGIRLTGTSFWNGFYGGDWEEANSGGNLVIESGALRNTIMPAHLFTGITDNGTDTRFYLSSFHRDVTGGFTTFANGDTTPSVAQFSAGGAGRYWQCGNSSSTSITNFDDATDQQRIVVRLDGNTTIVNNSSLIRLKGATNITGANTNNFVAFLRLSGIWFEEYRNF